MSHRIPLLVACTPKKSIGECAIVRIPSGLWRLVIEGFIDSQFLISTVPDCGEFNSKIDDGSIKIEEPKSVQVRFNKRGEEVDLNIYLEKI